jgi:hypothetical protein
MRSPPWTAAAGNDRQLSIQGDRMYHDYERDSSIIHSATGALINSTLHRFAPAPSL